jgi:DNA-binding transcriptional LysR family regulator
MFLDHVLRVFAALQQARDSLKAAANGFPGQLRIALSKGVTPSRCRPCWSCAGRTNLKSKSA